jgi:hypothetical protein
MLRRNRLAGALVYLGLALFCPACSGPSHPPVYPVRGQILVKGKPAANAMVTLHPIGDNGRDTIRPVGYADDSGHFTLTSYEKGDGAPEGEYRVTVSWLLATKARGSADDYVTRNHLPVRYSAADRSGLRVTIAKGNNDLPPFELKAN